MRILILTEAFPPETKSCSTLFFELAESLVKNGHSVSVVTRMPRYNVATGTVLSGIPAKEIINGINVNRLQTPPLARAVPYIRGFEHFLLGLIFFWGGLFLGKFDIILAYSPPLTLGISAFWLGKIKNAKVVSNIQDLYPQTVIDLGLLKNNFLTWVAKQMESFIYKKSDTLTVHSEGNKEYLIECGAPADRIRVIYNWVDTKIVKPGPKDNEFNRQFNPDNKFLVSFAGVMGFAQGLEVVIKAAETLKEEKNILFLLVGDGSKKPDLEKMAGELKMENVKFVPTQPVSQYPQILHASDVCLVILGKELVTPVVPGKLLSIMAAGKPVLASLPLAGDAPKIITANNCGLVVEAGEAKLLAKEIINLYNQSSLREKMGENGRRVAEDFFSRQRCVSDYEELFKELVQ